MKSGVFIERDVLLNLAPTIGQQKTPLRVEEFHVREDALAPIQRLKLAGYIVVVTTNQPEVSRGNLPRRELDLMHQIMRARLPVDDILVCPHDEEDRCPCRKPRPGLMHESAFKFHLELGLSTVISHRWQDAEAARIVGALSYIVKSPFMGKVPHDFVVEDFAGAVEKMLEMARLHRKVA